MSVIEFKPKTVAAHNAELTDFCEVKERRPAAKSSTHVATSATFCQNCGCPKGPRTSKRPDCKCLCHPREGK